MIRKSFTFALALALAPTLLACEMGGGSGGTIQENNYTVCKYPTTPTDDPDGKLKAVGEECEKDDECLYNACLMPGTNGNEINTRFGFCTHACHCSEDPHMTDEEKSLYVCVYPSGDNKHHRYLAVACGGVGDCPSGWESCKTPSTGGVLKICHADG
jgi:hypothetical protein